MNAPNFFHTKYSEHRPLRIKKNTAWKVTFNYSEFFPGNEIIHLLLFHEQATPEQVVDYVKIHYQDQKNFIVEAVENGDFEIGKTITSYSGDARKINQDMELVLP